MFSQEEFESRVSKVRAGMSEMGLSALVALDNESYMNGGNVRYLTNFLSTLSPQVGAVVITPERVTLCVNPGFRGSAFRLANEVSWVKDVIGTRSELWGHSMAQDIKSALNKAKVIHGKIGVDGLDLITKPMDKSVRAALTDFELVENTGIIDRLRMTKSPAECDVIREAARLADLGLEAFMKAVKAGGSVSASISEGEHTAKVHGAESAFMFMSPSDALFIWGGNTCHGSRGKMYKEGDMVSCELNAAFQGYYGQVARSFVIGRASEKQKRVCDTCLEAYIKSSSVLKPGVTASEVCIAGKEIIKKAGYEPMLMRDGHGMGLTIAEGFNLLEDDNTEIKPGYYVMIHNVVPFDEGVIILGNGFLVTETGCEDLHKVEFNLEI